MSPARTPRPSHRSFADPYGVINEYVEKTPRIVLFGKKSAKLYHCLYSSTEQLKVALWTFRFISLGLNNDKSIHSLPLRSVPFQSLPL